MTDKRARYALGVLTFINLFNYVDRFVLPAILEPIRREFGFSDTQLGLLASGFIVVYAVTSPLFGMFGPRLARMMPSGPPASTARS